MINTDKCILVKVPNGRIIIQGLDFDGVSTYLEYVINNEEDFILLPTGQYSTPFLAIEASESQAALVVEKHIARYVNGDVEGYLDYEYDENEPIKDLADVHYIPFDTATASIASLVRSHGLEPGECVIVPILK